MFNWLKDKLSGDSLPKNSALRVEDAKRLLDLLKLTLPDEPELIKRAMSFVISGEPPEVLNEFKNNAPDREKINEVNQKVLKDDARDLMTHLELDDPDALVRLGEVLRRVPWQRHCHALPNEPSKKEFRWISSLIRTVSLLSNRRSGQQINRPVKLKLELFLRGAEFQQQTREEVAEYLLTAAAYSGNRSPAAEPFNQFPDWKDLVRSHPEIIRKNLASAQDTESVGTLKFVFGLDDPAVLDEHMPDLAAALFGKNRALREVAEPLGRVHFERLRPTLVKHIADPQADARLRVVQLLLKYRDEAVTELLKSRFEEEKSAKVKDLIKRHLAAVDMISGVGEVAESTGYDAAAAWKAVIPEPLPPLPEAKALPASVLETLKECLAAADKQARDVYEEWKDKPYGSKTPPRPVLPRAKEIFELIQKREKLPRGVLGELHMQANRDSLQKFCETPGLELVHVIQWSAVFAWALDTEGLINWGSDYLQVYASANEPFSMRELARALETVGRNPDGVGKSYFSWQQRNSRLFRNLPEEPWKYFALYPKALRGALGMMDLETEGRHYTDDSTRIKAYKLLATMPALPPEIILHLWETALIGPKKERPQARAALESVPGKEAKIIEELSSAKQETRAQAALWLGDLGAKEAIEPIKAALAKEKNDVAKGAMFDALEKLGVPIAQFLDRKKLEAEAKKALAKGAPKEIASWLPASALPEVRWADNNQPVPRVIIEYFIAQAVKLKSAEPPALIRAYCGFLEKNSRAALGKFLLLGFLAEDIKPKYTAEEAAAEAQKQITQTKQWYARYPQYAASWDEAAQYKTIYNNLLNQCLSSAIGAKGLLGLCACCCTGEVSAPVYAFVKKWFGQRMAQCKALIIMLAHIPDRSAIQVLLTVGNRFRTKGLQEEARNQAQMLAEREGWTMDELADRTIPTAGFDEDGRQELDFGPRQFVARLTEDFAIELENSAGKVIKALPNPAQSDDADLAKAAKKAFSDSKKEIKELLKLQKERLYEALCTQREWKFEDWDAYLNRHPVVGLYCQKLVWRVVETPHNRAAVTFRPLADRTLTDFQDEAVEIAQETKIALAHESLVTPEIAAGWLEHFKDYDVKPLLTQFGREQFQPSAEQLESREIKQFEGYMLDAFTLRGHATKLGYVRGEAEDGGFFHEYRKDFSACRVRASLGFTGNCVPEENVRVALTNLVFEQMAEPGEDDGGSSYWNPIEGMKLSEVPPVLLNECWNDLRQVAAAGSGFDADWKKKAEWA